MGWGVSPPKGQHETVSSGHTLYPSLKFTGLPWLLALLSFHQHFQDSLP